MAYAIMPNKGEPDICDSADCGHRDCAQWRNTIGQPCDHCKKPVESGERYTYGPGLMHWRCAFEAGAVGN